MKKRKRLIVTVCCALLVCGIFGLQAAASGGADSAEKEEIIQAVKDAAMLSVSQDDIMDSEGNLLDKDACLQEYQARLADTFTESSPLPQQYYDIMAAGFEQHSSETSDIVLNNEVVNFDLQKFGVDGGTAAVTCRIVSLRRYICWTQNGYEAIFPVATKTWNCSLEKGEDGRWRVAEFIDSDHIFGSPVDMGVSSEDYQEVFATRREACEYANSITADTIFQQMPK